MIWTADQTGERIDLALSRTIEGLSRSAAQKLCDSGLVTRNGQPVRKNERVTAGEMFHVKQSEPEPIAAAPEDIPLNIVYEDGDVVVINKPKGMVVHPAAGHWNGTLVNALLHHCEGSLSGINGELRPGIVHRIDKDTSGLLIVAKNDFSHQKLAEQLQDHSLSRTYWCIVCGNLREDEGTVDAPIGRHPTDRKRMTVTQQNSRSAVTHYQVLARYGAYTLLRCRLETGRTHQIRVHMAHLGHPILGDMVYGRKKPELGMGTQCLHAKELTFRHPRTGLPLTVSCPLPEDFLRVLHKLGTPRELACPEVFEKEVSL